MWKIIKECKDIIIATILVILGILFITFNVWYLYVTDKFSLMASVGLVCDGFIICSGIDRGLLWLKEAEMKD